MSYEVKNDYLKDGHSKRPGGRYKKKSLTIHSTANPKSIAENERDWLDNPSNTRQASWHYIVGEGVVIQAIPEAEEAWHCNSKEGNRYSIGIEMIESGNRAKVLETAAEFVADKLKENGWSIADIKKHHDWSGKDCPRVLINKAYVKDGMDWGWFVKKVEECMGNEEIRYNKISELPAWAQPVIQDLVDKKAIADGDKLDLSMDMARVLVIVYRWVMTVLNKVVSEIKDNK